MVAYIQLRLLHIRNSCSFPFFSVLWRYIFFGRLTLQGCYPSRCGKKTTRFLLSLFFRMCPSWRPSCLRCVSSSCAAVLWCCVCKHTTPGNVRWRSASSPCDSSVLRRRSTGSTSTLRPNHLWVFTSCVMSQACGTKPLSIRCPVLVSITLSVAGVSNTSTVWKRARFSQNTFEEAAAMLALWCN